MHAQKCNSCFLEMNDEAGILSHEKKLEINKTQVDEYD